MMNSSNVMNMCRSSKWPQYIRTFYGGRINYCSKLPKTEAKDEKPPVHNIRERLNKVSSFQKTILVWTGFYKTKAEVPELVEQNKLHKAQTTARIRLANICMALVLMGCGVMIYSGKEALKRGETVTQMEFEAQRKYNAEHADK